MLILIISALVVLAVPLAGGRLRRLSDLRLRDPWLVLLSLAVQIVLISFVRGGPQVLWRLVHLATYATIVVFLVRNRSIPGLWLIAIGGLSNLVAIVANGGVLPASQGALERSGRVAPSGFANSAPVAHGHLTFLGDIFATPRWVPFANVFSFGDVALLLGLVWLTLTVSRVADSVDNGFIRSASSADGLPSRRGVPMEPVAHPGVGQEVLGATRGPFELAADVGHSDAQQAGVGIGVRSPDGVDDEHAGRHDASPGPGGAEVDGQRAA